MNKRNISIATLAIFLAGSISAYDVQSISARDARFIRKDLQEKYAQGLLNEIHLMEKDATFLDVLDRDILILENHKKDLKKRIAVCKDPFDRAIVSVFKGLGAFIFAKVFFVSGFISAFSCSTEKDIYDGNMDKDIKFANYLANGFETIGFFNKKDRFEYNEARHNELLKRYPNLDATKSIAFVAALTSLISGALSIKMALSCYQHNSKLDEAIMKLKNRVDRNNIIIAQLKELRYQALQQ